MDFVAVDVETANPNMASICQIGFVRFENGIEVEAQSVLVNPETWFDPFHVGIHGIDEEGVRGARSFFQLDDWIRSWATDRVVVSHTHFDRVAFSQSYRQGGRPDLDCKWLDSAKVTRRAWPQFSQRGYGLANIAAHCGITFKHHDALEDARASGAVLIQAINATGLDLDEWLARATRPISTPSEIRRNGDGDGALFGEAVVFTGALLLPRRAAADRAAEAGADVLPGVTKATTMLVVGDQDIARLNGRDKSTKHLKAEKLIANGQRIRIIGETDFMMLSSITN